jgi:hypothetical protein
VSDLGVDLHDPAVPPGLHPRQDGPADQHRTLHEKVQLGQVASPGYIGHRSFGLRAGGVEDQHIDRAEAVRDRGGQPGNLVLVGDIGAEALGGAAIVTDGADDGSDLLVAGPAIDRDGETVTRQPPRDHRPQAPRAARHQSDAPMRHCHLVMISLRPARPADAGALRAPRMPVMCCALRRGPGLAISTDRGFAFVLASPYVIG